MSQQYIKEQCHHSKLPRPKLRIPENLRAGFEPDPPTTRGEARRVLPSLKVVLGTTNRVSFNRTSSRSVTGNPDRELGVQFGGNVFLQHIRDKHLIPDLYSG